MAAKRTTCRHCGATFTPGVDGISPASRRERPVDLCDTCAHVYRDSAGHAIVDPEFLQKLITSITGVPETACGPL
jgi:RNase P subunit RPR2